MNTVTEIRSPAELRAVKAQWRGSAEGLVWTPWYPLTDLIITVPKSLPIKQVRLWIDGQWSYSPIGTADPVNA